VRVIVSTVLRLRITFDGRWFGRMVGAHWQDVTSRARHYDLLIYELVLKRQRVHTSIVALAGVLSPVVLAIPLTQAVRRQTS